MKETTVLIIGIFFVSTSLAGEPAHHLARNRKLKRYNSSAKIQKAFVFVIFLCAFLIEKKKTQLFVPSEYINEYYINLFLFSMPTVCRNVFSKSGVSLILKFHITFIPALCI